MNKSQAKEINILIKKQKKLLQSKLQLARFKEPVIFLMRRNNRVDFFEDATKGEFKYKHSDGDERTIIIDTSFIHTFEYGNEDFRGYILHEDEQFPLPQKPLVYAEMYKIAISKLLNDIKTWKAKELEAMGTMFYKILGGIGMIVLCLGGYYLITGEFLIGGSEVIKETIIQQTPTPPTEVNKGILGLAMLIPKTIWRKTK